MLLDIHINIMDKKYLGWFFADLFLPCFSRNRYLKADLLLLASEPFHSSPLGSAGQPHLVNHLFPLIKGFSRALCESAQVIQCWITGQGRAASLKSYTPMEGISFLGREQSLLLLLAWTSICQVALPRDLDGTISVFW